MEIKNNTNLSYFIRKDELAMEELDCDCFIVKCNGKELEYDGYLVKRGQITEESYILLKAGEKLLVSVNLEQNYKLDKTGYYTIQFAREIHFKRELKAEQLSESRREFVKSKRKAFLLLGRKRTDRLATVGETERGRESLRQDTISGDGIGYYQQPVIEFYGDEKSYPKERKETFRKMTLKAHYTMAYYLYFTRRELAAEESIRQGNLHYEMVFGSYNKDRYDKAKEIYDKVEEAVRRDRITYIYREMSKDNIFGYTTKGSRTVYLCQAYMRAALTGEDSKAGTILHELTHAAADTNDVCYGREKCRKLAKEETEKTIENADSYEFFLESKFLNRMTEKKWDRTENAEKTKLGGPVIKIFGEDQVYLFYMDKSGILQQAVYNKKTNVYGTSQPVMTEGNVSITAAGHPEAVVYEKNLYLFFVNKENGNLMMSRFLGERWTVPVAVETPKRGAAKPAYVSQPVVYQNKINFVYRESDGEGIYWIAGNGNTWEEKPDFLIVNQYYYNPAICVYKDTLYLFYQIQHNAGTKKSENSKIYYAYYNEKENSWSMNHSVDKEIEDDKANGRRAKIPTDACSAIRAENSEDVVYLIFRGTESEQTVQIQMGQISFLKNQRIWMDFEEIGRSSVENLDLKQYLSYAITGDKNYNYMVYQKAGQEGIYISTQMRG